MEQEEDELPPEGEDEDLPFIVEEHIDHHRAEHGKVARVAGRLHNELQRRRSPPLLRRAVVPGKVLKCDTLRAPAACRRRGEEGLIVLLLARLD